MHFKYHDSRFGVERYKWRHSWGSWAYVLGLLAGMTLLWVLQ